MNQQQKQQQNTSTPLTAQIRKNVSDMNLSILRNMYKAYCVEGDSEFGGESFEVFVKNHLFIEEIKKIQQFEQQQEQQFEQQRCPLVLREFFREWGDDKLSNEKGEWMQLNVEMMAHHLGQVSEEESEKCLNWFSDKGLVCGGIVGVENGDKYGDMFQIK